MLVFGRGFSIAFSFSPATTSSSTTASTSTLVFVSRGLCINHLLCSFAFVIRLKGFPDLPLLLVIFILSFLALLVRETLFVLPFIIKTRTDVTPRPITLNLIIGSVIVTTAEA